MRTRLAAIAGTSVLGGMISLGSWAQSTAPAEPDKGASFVEEVIVTAQKRAQNAQEVPISMAVFNEEMLENANVLDVKDLPKMTANFTIKRPVISTGLALQVRGIGALGNTAIEPSVASFLDGIYIPRAGAIFGSFLDVESVEVLRGPQGTLFGRNASVGAMTMQTVAPKDTFEGRIKAEAGTGSRYRLEGMLNVPLSEKTAFRIAALGEDFKGYWTNRADGRQFGGLDQAAVRASLRTDFTDSFSWILRADYMELDGGEVPISDIKPESLPQDAFNRLSQRTGGRTPDMQPYDRFTNIYFDPNNFSKDQQWGVTSTLSLELANDYTVKLLSGYRDFRNDLRDGDLTFLPIPILGRQNFFDSTSHSQELQLLTPTDELLGGRFNAVAGLYYFQEDYSLGEQWLLLDEFCSLVVNLINPALVGPCSAGPQRATRLNFAQDTESFAAYVQGDYKLLDTVTLTLGVRWTDESKSGDISQEFLNPAGALLRGNENTAMRVDNDEITYRANLSWQPTRQLHAFASYSTGFKSGGFNSLGSGAPLGQSRIFGPETVENLEFGVKTQWLDNRLVLNGTFYRTEVDGYQDRSAIDGINFTIRNSGLLRNQGFEFDGSLRASSLVRLNLAFAYLDSEFLHFPGATNLPGLPGAQDLTGGYGHFSPEWSGSFGVELNGALGHTGWGWLARTDLGFQTKQNVGATLDNSPQTMQDGYQLLSARLSLSSPDDHWTFSVFGNNLTDEGYSVTNFYFLFDGPLGIRQPGGRTAINQVIGNPRTFGASVAYNF